MREWDQQSWAQDRPHKTHDTGRAEDRWLGELHDAGLQTNGFTVREDASPISLVDVDRAHVAQVAIAALEESKSAWSVADLEGQIGVVLGQSGAVASREDVEAWVTESASAAADTLLRLDIDYQAEVPNWVRWITSERVVAVEDDLRRAFKQRGLDSALVTREPVLGKLTQAQSDAARALASAAPLVVVEGAAGAGKTTMLKTAAELAESQGRRFVVVAPTLRAAQEAGAALGTPASSAHKLAHEYGFRRDSYGRWARLAVGEIDPATWFEYRGPSDVFRVDANTRIIVDEAGMIDQDMAHALVQIADESGAALALVGDRAQLPAVGRGGVLDTAVDAHPMPLDLTELHRFVTPEGALDEDYAKLTLQMRSREQPADLFDQLYERGNLVIHETMDDARAIITEDAIARARAGSSVAIATATNEDAAALNGLIQQAHAQAGHTTTPVVEISGSDLLTIRNGDRLMTRKNDRDLGVANRDVWNVQSVHSDQSVTVTDGKRVVQLPAEYVKEHTHLAYAATEFGVQGATVQAGHGIVTDSSSASAVYVSATRDREANTLHVVAETRLQARELFVEAMTREVGDRGVEKKRGAAIRDLKGTVGIRTHSESQRAQAAWWGVDVDKPATRPAADQAKSTARDERERSTQRSEGVRSPDATARAARDTDATRIARDAQKGRQRTRQRGRGR